MLTRRQIWQARQRFLRALDKVQKMDLFKRHIESCREDLRYWQMNLRNWQREFDSAQSRGVNSDYIAERVRDSRRSVEFCQSRLDNLVGMSAKLATWLRECGLHPFFIGGEVSYCPKNRRRSQWSQRQKMKLERFILRHGPSEFGRLDSIHLETFCRALLTCCRKLTVRFIEGSEIVAAYRLAVGGESCMAGFDNPRLALYEENPGTVCMAIVCYEDQKDAPLADIRNASARCLIWQTNKGPFIDRRYFSGGLYQVEKQIDELVAEAVAEKFGKAIGSYPIGPDYDTANGLFTVCKKPSNFHQEALPYLDSMYHIYDAAEDACVLMHNSAHTRKVREAYLAHRESQQQTQAV